MAFDKAKKHLEKFHLADRIQTFPVSSATVALAAEALGCEEKHIAKSLTFGVDGTAVLIVAAGDAKVDNAKFKAYFHTKAKMLTPPEVESMIGHSVGGVCPFGIQDGVRVFLDVSLKRFDFVYPACGSANSAVKLTIPELEAASGYLDWIDVCKNWELATN